MLASKPFMFVNKSAESQSLSRSSGQERRRIFSHVQQLPSDDGRDAAITIHKWWAIDESEPPKSTSKKVKQKEVPRRSQVNQRRQSRMTKTVPAGNGPIREATLSVVRCQSQTPSIPAILEADPELLVDTTAVASSYIAKVMGYFSTMFAENLFPSQASAKTMLTHTLGVASKNAAARNALISAAASTMTLTNLNENWHEEYALYFKGIALYRLRKQIGDDSTRRSPSPALYAISLLLWTECLKGEANHVAAHMTGLQQILGSVKIDEHMPPSELAAVFGTSNLCSLMLRAPPLAPPLPSEAFDVRQQFDLYVRWQIEHEKTGFFEVRNAEVIGSKLLGLAARQRARHMLVHKDRVFEGLGSDHPSTQGMAYEGMNIDYRLLALGYGSSAMRMTPVQKVIRLCVYLVTQPMIAQMGPGSSLGRDVARQLHEAIDDSDISSLWQPHSELLLWVLFVTAFYTESGSRWNWLVQQIQSLFDALSINLYDVFQERMQRYLLVNDLFDETLMKVWNTTGRQYMLGADCVEDLD